MIHTPRGDGMAEIWALLPADAAVAVMEAIDGVATGYLDCDHHLPDPDRGTRDQRRADAPGEIAGGILTDTVLPRRHGTRPTIPVTVPLTTLLGDDDTPADLTGLVVTRDRTCTFTGCPRRAITCDLDRPHLHQPPRTTTRPEPPPPQAKKYDDEPPPI